MKLINQSKGLCNVQCESASPQFFTTVLNRPRHRGAAPTTDRLLAVGTVKNNRKNHNALTICNTRKCHPWLIKSNFGANNNTVRLQDVHARLRRR